MDKTGGALNNQQLKNLTKMQKRELPNFIFFYFLNSIKRAIPILIAMWVSSSLL